jgi:hypothetical protein
MKVKTPTTPAAIQAHCQSGNEVSFTLERFLSKPKPEIFEVPQEVRATSENPAISTRVAVFRKGVNRFDGMA